MNALDIGARGLARLAQQSADRTDDRGVVISQRADDSAVALEDLAQNNALLIGEAGATYAVTEAPYLRRPRLTIRGNGAEIRNVNQTELADDEQVNVGLPLGLSNLWSTGFFTYYKVLSAGGRVLTVEPGDEATFAPGDCVIVRGQSGVYDSYQEYTIYRNIIRAAVVAVAPGRIELDRALPIELVADSPVIANADEGIEGSVPGYPVYLVYRPHISQLVLSSDKGAGWHGGGIIDGVFRDLEIVGRNGLAFNAAQDCLFENIRFRAWRKICELAEGSYGTVVRGMRGTLDDYRDHSEPLGASPFFIAIGESSAECVFDDLVVSSGAGSSYGAACHLAFGRDNEIRNSTLRFPGHTGLAALISSNAAPGMSNLRSGFRNVTVVAPLANTLLAINDAGGGIEGCYAVDCRFAGGSATTAAVISGANGRIAGNAFESGIFTCSAPISGWRIHDNVLPSTMSIPAGSKNNRIVGNYIAGGFTNLTDALLGANEIRDNESDASRALNAAAVIDVGQTTVTTTAANAVYRSATFAGLKAGDRIFLYCQATTSSSGNSLRSVRPSVTSNGATTGLGYSSFNTPGTSCGVELTIEVKSDTVIAFDLRCGASRVSQSAIVSPLGASPLTVNLEMWVGNSAEPILVRGFRIVPVRPGMRHLELR